MKDPTARRPRCPGSGVAEPVTAAAHDFEVDFEPAGRRVRVPAGTTLLDAARGGGHRARLGLRRRRDLRPLPGRGHGRRAAAGPRRRPPRAVAQRDRRRRAPRLPRPGPERHQGQRPQGVADHRTSGSRSRARTGTIAVDPAVRAYAVARGAAVAPRRPLGLRPGDRRRHRSPTGLRRLHADPVVLAPAHAARSGAPAGT